MSQQEKILQALKEAGSDGINSYSAREDLDVIQLPARIWGLKQDGHTIIERRNSDKSVNYILLDFYKPRVKNSDKPVVNYDNDFVFIGNTAYRREEPKQEVLI